MKAKPKTAADTTATTGPAASTPEKATAAKLALANMKNMPARQMKYQVTTAATQTPKHFCHSLRLAAAPARARATPLCASLSLFLTHTAHPNCSVLY